MISRLCGSDSLLNEIGGLEMPIGPVRVQGYGTELDASLHAASEPAPVSPPVTIATLSSSCDSTVWLQAFETAICSSRIILAEMYATACRSVD